MRGPRWALCILCSPAAAGACVGSGLPCLGACGAGCGRPWRLGRVRLVGPARLSASPPWAALAGVGGGLCVYVSTAGWIPGSRACKRVRGGAADHAPVLAGALR